MKKNEIFLTAMVALALSLGMVLSGCASLLDLFKGKAADIDISSDLGGFGLRNARRISDDGVQKGWLAVSQDGQKLLYCEQPVNFDPAANVKSRSSKIIYLRNSSVFARSPINDDKDSYMYGPSFYENGTNFVYIQDTEDRTNSQLIKSSVNSSSKTLVTRQPVGYWDNNPSVRNGVIAFDTGVQGRRQIVTVRDNGQDLTQLGPGVQPSWHPAENRLVFTSEDHSGIWEMETETSQITQLYAISSKEKSDGVSCGRPSYSGDGRYIIFVKREKVKNQLFNHLYRIDADGSNLTMLTGGEINVDAPAYGAENEVFFIAESRNTFNIYSALVNVE
jgi:Tol biopolymer transport system component